MTARKRAGYTRADEQDGGMGLGDAAETLVLDEQEQDELITQLQEESTTASSRTSRNVDVLVLVSLVVSIAQLVRSFVRDGSFGTRFAHLLVVPLQIPCLSEGLLRRLQLPLLDAGLRLPRARNIRMGSLAALLCLAAPAVIALIRTGGSVDLSDLGLLAPALVAGVRILVDRDERAMREKMEELQGLRYRLKGA